MAGGRPKPVNNLFPLTLFPSLRHLDSKTHFQSVFLDSRLRQFSGHEELSQNGLHEFPISLKTPSLVFQRKLDTTTSQLFGEKCLLRERAASWESSLQMSSVTHCSIASASSVQSVLFSFEKVCFHWWARELLLAVCNLTLGHKSLINPTYWNFNVFLKTTVSTSNFTQEQNPNWQTSSFLLGWCVSKYYCGKIKREDTLWGWFFISIERKIVSRG